MTRRVPEFALLTGVFLAVSLGGFALWATRDLHQSVLVGAVVGYPFAAYAVRMDDDPTSVLRPRPIAVGALLVGLVVAGDVLLQARDALPAAATRAVALGSLVAVPPVAYAASYDRRLGPSGRPIGAVAVVATLVLPAVGAVGGTWYGAVAGFLVGLPTGLYADDRGVVLSRLARGSTVAVGTLAGCGLLVAGLQVGLAPLATLTAATALVVTPALFYALTVPTDLFRSSG
ncbi:hypothetical protein RYH80_11605 [Halobaculum sp. MBLA0147]|uniref:hypothetical protein n=1 Tax=Halobaculum sp. MBLA0147 TaxID=3079934 RepID=UPI0035246F96